MAAILSRGRWVNNLTSSSIPSSSHALLQHKTGDAKRSMHFMSPSRLLSGEPDYFGRNKISSGGDLSHYSSASLY